MRLTSFIDYGLRALMRIASDPARGFSSAELADEFDISRHHLTKIIQRLSQAGVVTTRRGGGGGATRRDQGNCPDPYGPSLQPQHSPQLEQIWPGSQENSSHAGTHSAAGNASLSHTSTPGSSSQ